MWCARIDIRRGTAADDLPNITWSQMLAQLPGYSALLTKQQDPSSLISMGNAMEMAVGLAYACHTNLVHLPDDHRIEFANGMQEKRDFTMERNVASLPTVGPLGDGTHA